MSTDDPLGEARALRDEARRLVADDMERLRASASPQAIKAGVKARVQDDALNAIDEAREIVTEHTGVIAATIALLVGWLARAPILRALQRVLEYRRKGTGRRIRRLLGHD